jgi:hypothetical protein
MKVTITFTRWHPLEDTQEESERVWELEGTRQEVELEAMKQLYQNEQVVKIHRVQVV